MPQLGRPRKFDRDVALEESMHLFWQHGYEATSLNLLKAGICGGISAPSFYAAFGSKEQLFREVVERYMATHGRVTEALWDPRYGPREAIEIMLRQSAAMQCEKSHPAGCMVALGVMSTCSGADDAVPDPLAEARAHTRAGLIACIERAMTAGDLPRNCAPVALAAVFDSFLLGLSTLARDGVAHEVLDAAVTGIMSVWDTAARGGHG